jgi:xylulokinase
MGFSENTMVEKDSGWNMLIGIDVGTTAVKASLFDDAGKVLQHFSAPYPTQRPSTGHVEQDPADWMKLVLRALERFQGKAKQVHAIGLTSQVNTHVFADAQGEALMPAMTWADTRAAGEAASLDAKITVEEKLGWWGAPLPIDASHPLARMAYVQHHHADIWAKTALVLAPKDYCLLQLTGVLAADPMTNFGLVDSSLQYVKRLTDLVDDAETMLPPLKGFTEIAGNITPGLPFAGTPMITCAMDAWAGLLGAGACNDGEALYLSGTSEILGIVSRKKAPTPGVIAFPECEGITFHAGPTQSGGASIAWVSQLLGKSAEELSGLAAKADLHRTPLFLPHLEGERAPIWDPASRGSFAGLTSSCGPAELARSVMEGVAYSARLLLESLELSACLKPTTINHSGGGSASEIWCQIRADVLGRSIRRTASRDAGVLGAALMAGVGAGLFPSLALAAKQFILMDQVFTPNTREADRHERRFAAYKKLYEQLKPVNEML